MEARTISYYDIKTRKMHNCAWCSESIGKGDVAFRHVFAVEESIGTCHLHVECDDACKRSDPRDWDEGLSGNFERGIPS